MATPAENRRRVAAAQAATVKPKIYHAPKDQPKGTRAFARKTGEPRRG